MSLLNVITLTNGMELPTGDDFVNKIFPNIWAFLVQLIAFIIMVLIVIKFAYKPIHNFIEKRKEYVQENLTSAAKENAEAKENNMLAQKNVNDSKKKAVEIVEEAQKEAEQQRSLALEETKKELSMKRAQAQLDLEKEKEKAMKEVHDDMVSIALSASESLLNREVSSSDNKKMLDDFVDNLETK